MSSTAESIMTTPPDLTQYGIEDTTEIVYNPSYEQLFAEETADNLEGYEVGKLTESGAIAVNTGVYTGRSPKDKYLVRDDSTRDTIWWADQGENDNKPIEPETWQALRKLVTDQLSAKRLFVVDTFCGTNPDTRLKVRFVMEVAWQAHFVTNMFIRPSQEELADYEPDFVVLNGSKTSNPDYAAMGLSRLLGPLRRPTGPPKTPSGVRCLPPEPPVVIRSPQARSLAVFLRAPATI